MHTHTQALQCEVQQGDVEQGDMEQSLVLLRTVILNSDFERPPTVLLREEFSDTEHWSHQGQCHREQFFCRTTLSGCLCS